MVLGVIASLNASGEIQKVESDTSQNLGTPLAAIIAATDAVNDIGVVITSSPGLISFANKAVVIADVANLDTENLILMDFDHLASNCLTYLPPKKEYSSFIFSNF